MNALRAVLALPFRLFAGAAAVVLVASVAVCLGFALAAELVGGER